MPWNGSGTFSRDNGTNSGSTTWADDAAAAIKITTGNHDTHDEDIATAISACLTKNMETKPTADFVPNATDTYDLGTTSLKWEDLHLNGDFTYAGVVQPKVKIIEIGDWDMDADSAKAVTHGLTVTNIRDVKVMVRSDAGTLYPIDYTDGANFSSGKWAGGTTTITVSRQTGEFFDTTSFDQTSYNRGWVTITYV